MRCHPVVSQWRCLFCFIHTLAKVSHPFGQKSFLQDSNNNLHLSVHTDPTHPPFHKHFLFFENLSPASFLAPKSTNSDSLKHKQRFWQTPVRFCSCPLQLLPSTKHFLHLSLENAPQKGFANEGRLYTQINFPSFFSHPQKQKWLFHGERDDIATASLLLFLLLHILCDCDYVSHFLVPRLSASNHFRKKGEQKCREREREREDAGSRGRPPSSSLLPSSAKSRQYLFFTSLQYLSSSSEIGLLNEI